MVKSVPLLYRRIDQLPPAFKEMLTLHMALVRLGFESKDIMAWYSPEGLTGLELKAQEKSYIYTTNGRAGFPSLEAFCDAWRDACSAVNTGVFSKQDVWDMYTGSKVWRELGNIVGVLHQRGFKAHPERLLH